MSIPLLKSELKSGGRVLLIFLAVISLYAGMITAMYDPETGEGLNAMAESMPQLFSAFGMENPGVTLLDFLNNYLYGFILIVIPFVYTIIMCYKLVAKYIDKGSMAYLLNTPYSRGQIILTQLAALLLGLTVLVLYATGLIILISAVMFEGELDVSRFLLLNLGLLILELFLASLCFLCACVFNELNFSVGLGAGAGLLFLLIQMLSQVSEDIEFLKYFTPMTLFNPDKLIAADRDGFLYLGILLACAVVFLSAAVISFRRRDLSL